MVHCVNESVTHVIDIISNIFNNFSSKSPAEQQKTIRTLVLLELFVLRKVNNNTFDFLSTLNKNNYQQTLSRLDHFAEELEKTDLKLFNNLVNYASKMSVPELQNRIMLIKQKVKKIYKENGIEILLDI
jgi:hypothetical protein